MITLVSEPTRPEPRAVDAAPVARAIGSSESTLVHCLAGLGSLTPGEIHLGGTSLAGMWEKQLTLLRRDWTLVAVS